MAKRVDLVPRENRCKIAESVARLQPSLPSFIPKDGFENFTSPFLKTHTYFLSFFPFIPTKRNETLTSRRKKRAGRPFVSVEEKGKKMSSLTHVHRTFHNYDSSALRNACWRVKKIWHVPIRTQRFGRNDHLCNKPSSSYLVRLETRGGEEEEGEPLIPFIFARFPSSGYNLITASISNFPHDDKPKSIPVREQ